MQKSEHFYCYQVRKLQSVKYFSLFMMTLKAFKITTIFIFLFVNFSLDKQPMYT